ncbi:hypothetical protein BSQ39_01305 [Loigolactobacillus backii]|uniref:DUF871 domain-containing protein n=1 Tax=Loigolactobacillus backii TaxID=375175 RepID=UPI000C1C851F|nr:MupG family TIM beta-alpha barrel fold protein [Loigolactobacillus backii]PIO82293.1 hypothetical protein BSQ39_01305 [Loigolactobacillus backii]
MRRLGVSLYPEHSTLAKDKEYLDLAHKFGYTRVFTSLLEITGNQDEVVNRFKQTIAYANQLGFVVMVDMNPRLFKQLGISYDDLSFFHDLGAWGVRLDEGFSGMEEARMTRNPYGLKIEINMSGGTHYLNSILDYSPEKNNLLGCHNFYPQRYTGLSRPFFNKWSKFFTDRNLNTAAFVSSQTASFGPWPVQDGLPTLEEDRDLPIAVQVKHLVLTGMINDVLIGNAYASETELKAAATAFFAKQLTYQVELTGDVSELERKIVLTDEHLYRGDQSAYLVRDTQPRTKYRDEAIPAHDNQGMIQPGDVIIVNSDYGQYKAELQIALQPLENDGRRNVVGHLVPSERLLLDYIRPWSTFKLIE